MKNVINLIKRQKFYYYTTNIFRLLTPNFFYRKYRNYWLNQASKYPKDYINNRLNYYIDSSQKQPITNSVVLKNFIKPSGNSQYFFDLIKTTKYFNTNLKIKYLFGDVTTNQEEPTIVKSRPIKHTGNSILMKLDALRHFNFVEDTIPFTDKKNEVVWRGEIHNEKRRNLVQTYFNNPICNVGLGTKRKTDSPWKKEYLNIQGQLQYKFIVSIEGIDVATNLKWIMNSNSLCFMPTPIYETWFMEGKLIPNVHYVHVKDDFSDLLEKVNYYTKHTEKALEIIKNANTWTQQFKNKKLEKTLSILVLNEYFKKTNQKI